VTKIAKEKVHQLRENLISNKIDNFSYDELVQNIIIEYNNTISSTLVPLINATGVILHTNMGRSLISEEIFNKAFKVVCNYSNIEYDIANGCRGERYEHISKYIKTLLDVEDVLVVNNNASAVFLILNTFAKNKEVIVSRGELVEIGGSFRIPEVMRNSLSILNEVGATNKTRLSDYEQAINENTSIIMKVHKSNYSIEGFSDEVDYKDIQTLATKHNLIDYYDVGSGYISALPYNLGSYEKPLNDLLKNKPSLLSFSGDKLFGSVQAGIIVGKKKFIDKLKENQLLRMLRVDKITMSILQETLKAYIQEKYELIPTLKMLFLTTNELNLRASKFTDIFKTSICETIDTVTYMGGGTLPNKNFPSLALWIKGKANKLEKYFRDNKIIGRIENDKFLLDFRTILPKDEDKIIKTIQNIK
jgi:L-seryl-tRNA(Ser) seleniumtransferase